MRIWPVAGGLLALAGAIFATQGPNEQVLILSGDLRGYLAPCGCSQPMIGGIKRQATAIRRLGPSGKTTILENSGLVMGAGRQDQIKLETLAQAFETMGVAAANFGSSEAQLGPGYLLAVHQLSGARFITGALAASGGNPLPTYRKSGPFLIGGASSESASMTSYLGQEGISAQTVAQGLVDEAAAQGLSPVLLLDGSRSQAQALAKARPELALIQYRASGAPAPALEYVGKTALATPGDSGKAIVRLTFRDGKFGGYKAVQLSPSFEDDPDVTRLYNGYLKRIGQEDLLAKLPRKETAAFSGSWSCVYCHKDSTKTWKHSEHAVAYQTLEKVGHSKDPDCVSCHVVGLGSTKGFKSRLATPQLAGVGCESCHGPGKAHAQNPLRFKMAAIDKQACVTCHNPQNSPNFDFPSYWKKIQHR